jgi:glycosyltransferase involved in cell wall biosynthesis
VERAQMRLVAQWLALGRRVTLVAGVVPPGLALPDRLELVRIGSSRFRHQFVLPDVVRERAPDVIFCPGNHYTSVAAWTRRKLGRACPPIVGKLSNAIVRGDHGAMLAFGHRLWLARHGRFLDHLVAMTPATAEVAAHAMNLGNRVSVIPNPPPVGCGTPLPIPFPAGPVVLGVGRLVPQKRWDRLVDALPLLPADACVLLLGEGRERRALRARAEALGVGDRLLMPGHVPDPLPAMARAQVMALPSDFEGVPGVLREALSVGTPVVATDCSQAIAEIVSDPSLGTVVPRDDAAALVRALAARLAPDAPRPAPVPQPGTDSAERYLELFDRLTA